MNKQLLVCCIVILLSLPVIYPFLERGFFPTHDGGWAVVRLAEMHRELRELQIPPRWAGYLNHGFGYPLFLFSYPFPYFLGELFHLTGLGVIDSVKMVFIFSIITSGVGMFLLGQKLWGVRGALISCALYIYAPYRMVNLFIRGSIGESLAFAFFPFLFYFLLKLKEKPNFANCFFTSICLAAFVITHNALVILFLPVLFTWVLFLIYLHDKNRIEILRLLIITIFCALSLSAFFWLPALAEKQFTILNFTPLTNKFEHFATFKELFFENRNFGIKPPLSIGIIHTILAILGMYALLSSRKVFNRALGIFFTLIISITGFMILAQSHILWTAPLLKEIDFPWRILSVLAFLLSLAGGSISIIKNSRIVSIFIVLVVVSVNIGYIRTSPREFFNDAYYETNDATTTSLDEYIPKWVSQKPADRLFEKAYLARGGIFIPKSYTSIKLIGEIETRIPNTLIVNTVYFPGWKAFVDNNEILIQTTDNTGLISFPVNPGKHTVKVIFSNTPVRSLANILTISGTILMFILWRKRKILFHY